MGCLPLKIWIVPSQWVRLQVVRLLARNSSISLAGSEEQIIFFQQSPKMLKIVSENFIHALLLFLGLFLNISRWVPPNTFLPLTKALWSKWNISRVAHFPTAWPRSCIYINKRYWTPILYLSFVLCFFSTKVITTCFCEFESSPYFNLDFPPTNFHTRAKKQGKIQRLSRRFPGD